MLQKLGCTHTDGGKDYKARTNSKVVKRSIFLKVVMNRNVKHFPGYN